MTACGHDVLEKVVATRSSGTMWVRENPQSQWPCRFLAAAQEQDGLWAQPIEMPALLLNELIGGGKAIQVSFNHERQRYVFPTVVLGRNKHYWLTEQVMVEAVLLRTPVQVAVEDRRAHPRLLVPDGSSIFAQLTRPSGKLGVATIQVKPWDVSAGGAGFVCPYDQNLMAMSRGQRLGVLLCFRSKKIVADATLCFSKTLTGRVVKIGVQFDPQSMTDESTANLNELIADLKRLEGLRRPSSR